jgi:hypothetical protein
MLVLSFLVAWFTVNTAQEIIDNSKESPIFNTSVRTKQQINEEGLAK